MNPATKAAIKTSATFAAVGGAVLLVAGNPVAWALLAIGTYNVGKTAYAQNKRPSQSASKEEDQTYWHL